MAIFSSLAELFETRIAVSYDEIDMLAAQLVTSLKNRMYGDANDNEPLKAETIKKKIRGGARYPKTPLVFKEELVQMLKQEILDNYNIMVGYTKEDDHYCGIEVWRLAREHETGDQTPDRPFLHWTDAELEIVEDFFQEKLAKG